MCLPKSWGISISHVSSYVRLAGKGRSEGEDMGTKIRTGYLTGSRCHNIKTRSGTVDSLSKRHILVNEGGGARSGQKVYRMNRPQLASMGISLFQRCRRVI